jgi:preprotein translocase subunit SecE
LGVQVPPALLVDARKDVVMAMNREQKRLLRKQGDINDEGAPTRQRRAPKPAAPADSKVGARQFVREVRSELRKVAWPTRSETLNYSLVVLVTLIIVMAFVFGVDWIFSNLILKLFEV